MCFEKNEKSKFNRGLPFPATIRLLNFEKKTWKKSQMLLLKNKLLKNLFYKYTSKCGGIETSTNA